MAGWSGLRVSWRWMAALAASAMALTSVVIWTQARPAAVHDAWHPPAMQRVRVLPRPAARPARHPASLPRTPEGARPAAAWPAAGSAVVRFLGLRPGGLARAPGLPVLAGPATETAGLAGLAGLASAGGGLSAVSVRVLAHSASTKLGVSGVVFTVGGIGAGTGLASVALEYSRFAAAYGGDFGSRLHLVELPACALTRPGAAACRARRPLPSVNDGRTVRATVTLSAATGASDPGGVASLTAAVMPLQQAPSLLVLAAVSGSSGSNGDFTVSSLSPQGTWLAGGQSGDFAWSYPVTVPPPSAGSAPQVALDYNSGSVDGRVASTNNQFGMIGEGFTLSTDSYIERTYTDCADDPEGAISGMYDACWAGQVVTMSLDGRSTPLVLDDVTKTWHEATDSGDQVQYLTGTAADTGNGTYDNGYWVVTTPDGTRYFFGKNKGPGWASGDPVTNSAFTEPVYGPHSGDPCYSSAGFTASVCTQAWRWNLDFVIDANGNAMAYYYNQETNYYGAAGQTTGVQYVRNGYLTRIDYGLRDEGNSIYGTANAPDQVVFGAVQRCIPTASFSCSASEFNATNASYWPDTPQDQLCAAGASCANHAPTFWSQMRIDSITTQYWNGSSYLKVDSYALGQGFPSSGDPELILNSITRTGYSASGASSALPADQLSYQLMDNRIPGYNSEPAMSRWRLTSIETETGEVIAVTYSSGCTASQIPASPSANITLCYPVMWTPYGDQSPILDYFNKYTVSSVLVQDGTADYPNQSPSQLTSYVYVGSPAWHYDDNEVVKAKDRTWGQFRGYPEVDTLTGNPQNITNGTADVQTLTKTRYFQGMNGDTTSSGGITSGVTVTDSNNVIYSDDNALAGQVLETQQFSGNGGTELSASITVPQVVQTTASRTRTGLPALTANMVRQVSETDYTDLAVGGALVKATTTTYDSDGRPVLADVSGTSVPQTCTQTSYDDGTAVYIRNAVSETITAAQACPSSPGGLTSSDIIKDIRTYFDGATNLTTPPTAGNPTRVDAATASNSGTLTFQTQQTAVYDASGRVISVADGLGHVTTTAYTPADGGPLTQVVTTNALSQTTTTVMDPGRGSVLSSTDAAGYLTTASYDPLGRLTAVWKPGRSQSAGAAANVTYAYQVSQSAPVTVTTNTLVDYGAGTNYVTSVSIYDSLGQLRETQTAAEGGNSVFTDNFYDSHGWLWQTYNRYVVQGAPSQVLQPGPASNVNDRTIDTFDGAGRVTSAQDYNASTLTDVTQTVYSGDQVTTVRRDPLGNVIGTPIATVTNVLGQQTQTIQYASPPAVSGSVVSGGSPQVTAMSYDAAGNKTGITDPAGNTWSYSYDLLGRRIEAIDPDTGTTTTGYDAAGNIAWATGGSGVTDNYSYDALNRKTAEHTGSATQGQGTLVAAWVWDTFKKGLLSYETSVTPAGVTYKDGNLGYDSYGNPSGRFVQVPSGQPLAGTYRTTYSYSSTGQLLSETPANAGGLPIDSIAFTYDAYGNPVTEKGYDTYVNGATWSPYNQISQIVLGYGPSAASLTYSYDPQTGNVTGISLSDQQPSPQVDNIAYTYNADQQVTQIADTQGGPGAQVEDQCFTYDSLSRLNEAWTSTDACAANPATGGNTTVQGPEPYWQTWTFNSVGDITSRTDHAPAGSTSGDTTTTYSYGVAAHAHAVSSLSVTNTVTGSQPGTSYSYDGSGNTAGFGSQVLGWTANGSLASSGTSTNPTANASYVYGADGTELVQADTSGATTTTTLYLPGEQITTNGTTTIGIRYYSFAGHVIAETTPSTLYWLSGTTQGTMTTAVAAFSQTTVIRRASTPYGTPLTGTGTGTWPDNRTFLGDAYDTGTGLVDIGARQFNPATGLFMSVDPVLDASSPQTMTGYTYAADNPVSNSDPTGLMFMMGGGGGTCATTTPGCPGYQPPSGGGRASGGIGGNGYMCARFGIGCGGYNPSPSHSSANSDHFPNGYNYFFQERILPTAETGSPVMVMRSFQLDPKPVFPFAITGCDSFKSGVTCTLHAAPSAFHGVGEVRVSTTPTSFTFTVISTGYFDSPGSHITFAITQRSGYLYLSQHGVGYNSTWEGLVGGYLGFAEYDWERQAQNLRTLLAENYISENYLGQPAVWGPQPAPTGPTV